MKPQPLWLIAGVLVGAAGGLLYGLAVAGASTAWASPPAEDPYGDLGFLLPLGAMIGGCVGMACGLFVGTALTFLVGRDVPRSVGRRRAAWVGGMVAPLPVAFYLLRSPDPLLMIPVWLVSIGLVAAAGCWLTANAVVPVDPSKPYYPDLDHAHA